MTFARLGPKVCTPRLTPAFETTTSTSTTTTASTSTTESPPSAETDSNSTSQANTTAITKNRSAPIRLGISLLQRSPSPHPQRTTTTTPPTMLHTILLPSLSAHPYLTSSSTLAADFRAWGHTVVSYPHTHHSVQALLTLQVAEGEDQTRRREELLDAWCAEWVRRWVGGGLNGRGRGRLERSCGELVGVGGNCFTEEQRGKGGAVEEPGRRTERGGWWVWLGFGSGRTSEERAHEELPRYSKGEDPPAYEH